MMAPFGHAAHAFLEGTITTTIAGHRLIKIGTTNYQVAPGTYTFADFITAADTAITGSGWSVARNTGTGAIEFTKDSGSETDLAFPDALGPLLGFGTDPGDTVHNAASAPPYASNIIPRASVPLIGATWDEVDLVRETHVELTRFRRSQGYTWGACRVWRWRLTMSRHDLEAVEAGWCLRGQVRIVGSDSAAISSSNPDGALSGYVMGIEGRRWLGPTQEAAEIVLLVTSDGA